MRALLDAFPQGRVILLLDNFENLVDAEKLAIKDGEMSDALSALLTAPQHAVKAILTTRIAPRDLAMVEPGRQHPLDLDDGLESPYAENVLREMDADGRVGLKNAPEPLLNKAREKTRGYPRALEALYAILSVDRYTTLEELLEIELPKEVVEKLVGEAFNRLDPTAQKVMQALAIYNRPVSPAAIDYLLQPHLPSIDSALVLNRLVNMHFARREAGRYYLHPADREYAFGTIPVEELLTTKDTKVTKENPNKTLRSLRALRFNTFTQHGLIERAADFFAQARKPRAEWKKLDDLAAQLAEFDLRCAAGDYDSAASVLLEIDFDYLLLWGHYRLMIDMHLHVKDKITDKTLLMGNLNGLGLANQFIGNNKESVIFYDQGLEVAHESKDRSWQGSILGNLGNTYVYLGDTRKAIECYEQALIISREIGDQLLEGNQLGSMGTAYHYLGNIQKAIEYQKAALEIAQNIGDRKGESNRLGNLGNRYSELGDDEKAIEYYEKCIFVKQEIGDRSGESIVLGNSGNVWTDIGEYQKAKESYQRAIQIADEISFSKLDFIQKYC
ncbi:MAG TPA: tetratricopeptide repeat protein [Anaerolineales bacterium]